MRLLSAIAPCWAFLLLVVAASPAADHVFVYPSANVNLVQALDAADLSVVGEIAAPPTAFEVLRTIDGSKYYVVSRRAEASVVVVDAASLLPIASIDLGVSPSGAAMSPDGRYLLLVGSGLHVIDTATDTLGPVIDIGGQPTDIVVDDASTTAFVLAARGAKVSVVDLESLTVRNSFDFSNGGSIALSNDGARLLVAFRGGIAQFRVGNLEPIEVIPGNFTLVNPQIFVLPGSRKVVVQSRGVAPSNTSQLFDLDTGDVRNIGSVGVTELEHLVFVDSARGYAIESRSNQVVELDLTATPDPTVTPLSFGANARDLALSPTSNELFITSLVDASATRVDTRTNTVTHQANLPIAPGGHAVVYGPSMLPPASLEVHGGDGQFYPPNVPLPVSLTVRVTDRTGRPLANVPVLFEDPAGAGLQLSPEQPSFTNMRGVASVQVTIPPKAPPPPPEEGEPPVEEEPIEKLTLQAKAAGLDPVAFVINAIRGAGLIRVSGNYQMTSENQPFPREIVVLATDAEGAPLPRGTVLDLGPSGSIGCFPNPMIVGAGGFARTQCNGVNFPTTSSQFFVDSALAVIASQYQPALRELASTSFSLTVGRAATILTWEKLGGDNQTAPSGTDLPKPLRMRLNVVNGFGRPNIGRPIHVEVTTESGPPVILEPKVLRIHPGSEGGELNVRLGPNAGTTVLKLEASSPGLPATFFTINATGGSPTRLEVSGDNQTGKIASRLPQDLRVQVVNESGDFVEFPEVTWRVLSGDATLEVVPDASGSNAAVTFGNNPGPVSILAAIGGLQHIFNLSSVPPEPTSISTFSGQNQTLTTGILSDPLVVQVNEADSSPAAGARVSFAGPPSVRLHPVNGSPPGNPVQVIADLNGQAAVRVELVGVMAAAFEEGGPVDQISSTVTITANVGGNLATSFLLSVAGRTPVFSAERVQNAASFEVGIVPGSLASIFGTGLMEGVVGFEQPNGATSFNGTTVRIGGVAAPLLLLAAGPPEQINVQAPFELAPGQNTTVEITNNGSTTIVANVPVFRAQPGIFEFAYGSAGVFGAVIHADTGDIVTPENPAEYGEAVSLFATGVGRTNPAVGTGVLGPLPPPVVTLPVIVGVDNAGAPILFSGYAPGFLGVYQVNFTVPTDIGCGVRSLNMKVGDSVSPNTSIAIRCP